MILEAALISSLAAECAPNVDPSTMHTLVVSESSGNPYAIGVTVSPLVEQPTNKEDAIATARSLLESGANISVGLGQINHKNFEVLGLTIETAFEFCPNLKAADEILSACFKRAEKAGKQDQEALQAAFSCYYSNNFRRGFVKEKEFKNTSYVERIANTNQRLVPKIKFSGDDVGNGHKDEVVKKNEIKKQKAIEVIKEKDDNWDVFKDF